MGCPAPFFLPYLSDVGADRDSIVAYYKKYDDFQDLVQDATGYYRQLAFLTFNDSHFNTDAINASNYNYFKYRETECNVDLYYRRALALSKRAIMMADSLASELRLNSILGINFFELLQVDYATLIEFEDLVAEIEEEHVQHRKIRARILDDLTKDKDNPPKKTLGE